MLEDFQLEVGAPLDVRLRPQSMRRALRNVIENAIRYGGKAEVTYKRENERAVIEIRDYGTGIPNELLEDVFEPFSELRHLARAKQVARGSVFPFLAPFCVPMVVMQQ